MKGKLASDSYWDAGAFNKEDSIYLNDDLLFELDDNWRFNEVLKFDPFGETESSAEDWKGVCERAAKVGGLAKAVIDEANEWVKTLPPNDVLFTIIGI